MIESLYQRRWTRSQPLVLPATNRSKMPVKVGVSTERDNTQDFRSKLKLAGVKNRCALNSNVC